MLSSSPVIVLIVILLGALLSYGEATVPLDGQETLEEHETFFHKTNIYITYYSVKEVENVAVKALLKRRTETDSAEVYVRERASDDDFTCDPQCEEKNVAYIASDAAILSGEEYIEEERTPNDNLQGTHCEEKNVTFVADDTVLSAEPFNHTKISATVECKEGTKEIDERTKLQELESTCTGSCNNGVHSQYQFGEFMRSCWQPVMRQDPPCSDSESDLTDESSSADASMTDIIPMLEELHSMINSGTGELSLASRDNLNSSSDDNEDDLQSADVTRKLQDASSFHVRVPSISTPRHNPFDPSRNSEETLELPQIPGSAPSVFLPRQDLFDLPFERAVRHRSQLQESWTPRSRFRSSQNMKHTNSYGQHHSTYLQHENGVKMDDGEISDNHCDHDAEQKGNNG